MPTALTVSQIRFSVGWEYTNTTGISGALTSNSNSLSFSDTLADGTGIDQAKIIYYEDKSALAEDAVWTIDLESATTDVFGTALNFNLIKLIYLEHRTPAAVNGAGVVQNDCVVAGTALTAAAAAGRLLAGTSPTLSLRPGGFLCFYTPDATAYGPTVAGTADTITVTNNSATAVDLRAVIIGTT